MSKQAELFQENAVEQINLPDADILYWPYFFEAAKANELLQSLIQKHSLETKYNPILRQRELSAPPGVLAW